MVNSSFTLCALAAEWCGMLSGHVIADAWSQHRGELIVAIEDRGQLHMRLHPPVQCAFRSPISARARRNAVTLFTKVRGRRISGVHVAPGDRILILKLDGECELQVFLFGSRANAFLVGGKGTVSQVPIVL